MTSKARKSKNKTRLLIMLGGGGLMLVILFLLLNFISSTPLAVAETEGRLHMLRYAATNYYQATGQWPASVQELQSNSVMELSSDPKNWVDAWDNPIIYEPYSTNKNFGRVLSYGRDGKPGGTGADRDIEMRLP